MSFSAPTSTCGGRCEAAAASVVALVARRSLPLADA